MTRGPAGPPWGDHRVNTRGPAPVRGWVRL